MPRAAHAPTDAQRRQVRAMSAYGIPQPDIALVIGVDPKTLRKFYRDELDKACAEANAKVAESLFRKATSDTTNGASVTAAIFWLKTRAGWKETVVNEHTGKDGAPIAHEHSHTLAPDAAAALDAIAGRLASGAGSASVAGDSET